ncbi:hypothetical protein N9L02_02295, partial [Gammaproteobacteria bacterium]|nr:hypothetical protein [Gammaproteobacteria bacterium]
MKRLEKNNLNLFKIKSQDTASVVSSFLKINDLISASKVSHYYNTLFTHSLSSVKNNKLLQAVVYGEYDKVNMILTANPELLLLKGTVTDYSYRVHKNRTAYQLALGAGDTNIVRDNGSIAQYGMVEMILEHFNNLPGKNSDKIEAIINDQYRGQFPDGWEEKEAKRVKDDKKALDTIYDAIKTASEEECELINILENEIYKIIRIEVSKIAKQLRSVVNKVYKAGSNQNFEIEFIKFYEIIREQDAIKHDKFNLELLKEIYRFRNYLEPKTAQTIGKHFNMQLLVDVAASYEQNYYAFNERYSHK